MAAMDLRPDHQLVARLAATLAANTQDPNAAIAVNPIRDGIITSIEAYAFDPALTNAAALGGGQQAVSQEWGVYEKLLGAEWKINDVSQTNNLVIPVMSIGGNGARPKFYGIKIGRNDTLYVTFKTLHTAGPALLGFLIFNVYSLNREGLAAGTAYGNIGSGR